MAHRCKVIDPNNKLDTLLYEYFTSSIRPGYIEIGEEKYCMCSEYLKIADDVENFEIYDSDVIVASHPKTGTTWTQEMVWMISNNLDFKGGEIDLNLRFPFLEMSGIIDAKKTIVFGQENEYQWLLDSVNFTKNQTTRPRFIKTHLAWSVLPKQIREGEITPKIIYVMRNPQDTCVSYYYGCKLMEKYNGDFETFCDLFIGGRLINGPFWTNVLGYWNRKDQPNILILKYEDMKKDLDSVILQVARFLDKSLTEEQVEKLSNHLNFENMKNNNSVNFSKMVKHVKPNGLEEGEGLIRSGQVGTYSKMMSADIIKKFEEWTIEHTRNTGLNY